MQIENLMEKIVSLAKRRGFVYPGSEIYGGLANSWDYGPLGVELKNNIKKLWWDRYVHRRDDIVGLDAALIMNPKVWEASGHVATFSDPLVECEQCHERFRSDNADLLLEHVREKHPGKTNKSSDTEISGVGFGVIPGFTPPRQFNLMLKTFLGPAEEQANAAYFRPETAQGMFVDFKQVIETSRKKPPFGIAQIGKAFRNEITPGNFIFRTREFEQMEIEYFIPVPKSDADWQAYFEKWRREMLEWMDLLGLPLDKVHEVEISAEERAHYSKRTIDFEYDFPFGRKELYGLAYRTDFDLKNHEKASGTNMKYRDQETGEEYWPHVIEPTWGVDRSVLAVLAASYAEDNDPKRPLEGDRGPSRVYLKLPFRLAPYKAAVFPLLANKPDLVGKARTIYEDLRREFMVDWDDRGNIGKRYFSQDEIGTPYCITVDFDSLKNDDVTVRARDTAIQERVKVSALADFLRNQMFRDHQTETEEGID
ncbi:MAG TPA: glycine--tRNA ligase [Candidatus Paceibacterota bacterium]|nr:glycine--tRNA ligase [Candidatus Paceibacterota bacterium]